MKEFFFLINFPNIVDIFSTVDFFQFFIELLSIKILIESIIVCSFLTAF